MGQMITLYYPNGEAIADVEATFSIEEVQNHIGQGTLTIPFSDPALQQFQEDLVRPGRLIVIQDDDYGVWGGELDLPISMGPVGLSIGLYSSEILLKFRRTPDGQTTLTGSPGNIFSQLIDIANGTADTRIRQGAIYDVGDRELTVAGDNIYDKTLTLADRYGEDYWLVPDRDDMGRLIFVAYWAKRRGEDVSDRCTLFEDKNLRADPQMLTISGEIINDVMTYGTGSTWDAKIKGHAQDDDSIQRYTLRQKSLSVSTTNQVQADKAAAVAVEAGKEPVWNFSLTAIDWQGTFGYLKMGNTVGIQTTKIGWKNGKFGFDGVARIVSRKFASQSGSEEKIMPITAQIKGTL